MSDQIADNISINQIQGILFPVVGKFRYYTILYFLLSSLFSCLIFIVNKIDNKYWKVGKSN